jgi:oligosaccharyltransferase complex subunit alpha (ribophorin I)
MTFKEVTKAIEVSHWGNIAIEETYLIRNEGAKLAGEYSRVDFNQYT